MKFTSSLWLLLGTVLAWSTAHAAPGTLLRDESLRSQPSASASVSARASRGTAVDIMKRSGGWLQVRTSRGQGWVRLLSVRSGQGGSGGAGLSDVLGVATRRSNPSRVVAVAGVRGLSEEDLKHARFDGEELARLDREAVTQSQARAYAGKSALVAVSVPSLPNPQNRSGASRPDTNSTWGDN